MQYVQAINESTAIPATHSADSKDLILTLFQSQREGRNCLPYYLGMMPLGYVWLGIHFGIQGEIWQQHDPVAFERGQLRQELLEMRRDEWEELRDLLYEHRSGLSNAERLVAEVVAAGCLGGDHLWRDLGLRSRDQLSLLMAQFFQPLAAANFQDMKWKKFFYKQLCEAGGGYVCRAPSCEECAAYDDCFGPET